MGKSKQYRQAFLELKETYESRIQKIEFGSGSEDGNGPPSIEVSVVNNELPAISNLSKLKPVPVEYSVPTTADKAPLVK